jgi:hypothetical protein
MLRMRYMLIVAAVMAIFCTSPMARIIYFAGYDWRVKSGDNIGPGPNSWDEDNVWIDPNGHLHLVLTRRDGR